jgi:hypothetical protein
MQRTDSSSAPVLDLHAPIEKKDGEHNARTPDAERRNRELRDILSQQLGRFGANWHRHSLVGLKVEALARVIYYQELYQKILEVPGVICEFGVQWGATLAELVNLRSIYEPFNASRTVYGFDTFEGFPTVHEKDGAFSKPGDYSSVENYEVTLKRILSIHEQSAPQPHIRKFQLIKGDASQTIDVWMEENPHAIISMAIFDMDLYEPTKNVLGKIIPRLTKGSLLVFDELNCPHFPGETRALNEVLGSNNLTLRRSPLQPYPAWAVYGQ